MTSRGLGERGGVFAEYVVILVLVAVGGAIATRALGTPLVQLFLMQEAVLLFPFPV